MMTNVSPITAPIAASRSATVADLLHRSAARTPDGLALVVGAQDPTRWTYAELDAAVTDGARALRALGLGRGDRVAAYGKNSDAYLIAYLACARAGLVHVPINFALTGDELAYLLDQSGARALLVDPSLRENYETCGVPVEHTLALHGSDDDSFLALARTPRSGPVLPDGEPPVAPDELVQLLYTSGTTSRPKGAMMTHAALTAEYVSAITALDLDARDAPLHPMPLYHSAQMHVFLVPYLAVGATNHLIEAPDIPTMLRLVEERSLTSLFLAPTVWVPLANHPDVATRDLTTLRKAFYGASIMPVPVLQRLQRLLPGLGFYNCFGQSEIGPLATVLRPEEHAERPDSCGRAVLNVELAVVDSEGEPVGPGEEGEVVYRSPQLCTGYWNNPEASDEAFRGGWFHSGDLVRVDAEGYLSVVDRIKDVINTGGVLVASREVEDALYTHPGVAEVAVIGTPDERWIEAVTAVVVPQPDSDLSAEELIAHARERLAGFKTPKHIRFVTSLPRNQSGKLLKRVLRDDA